MGSSLRLGEAYTHAVTAFSERIVGGVIEKVAHPEHADLAKEGATLAVLAAVSPPAAMTLCGLKVAKRLRLLPEGVSHVVDIFPAVLSVYGQGVAQTALNLASSATGALLGSGVVYCVEKVEDGLISPTIGGRVDVSKPAMAR